MMLLLRRCLVLVALFFWQGGFVFYAGVVVPVGTDVFEHQYRADSKAPSGKRQQGRITRTVARWLNVAGVVALIPMGWDVLGGADPLRRRKRWRALLCLATAVLLAILIWLHFQLDALFDVGTLALLDESAFYSRHRLYLTL